MVGKDKITTNCEITYEVLNNSYISYKFSFNKEVKNFDTKDIKLYNAKKQETLFGNNITLSISTPAYTVNVTQGKTYLVMFDYESIENEKFEFGLYSETVENLPTKTLTATTEKKHEEYKIKVNSSEEIFKIAINTQSSNNIKITNFEILEIENDNIERGAFVKLDKKLYTLVAEYNKDSRYIIIIDKETLTDLNENKNLEIVKGI